MLFISVICRARIRTSRAYKKNIWKASNIVLYIAVNLQDNNLEKFAWFKYFFSIIEIVSFSDKKKITSEILNSYVKKTFKNYLFVELYNATICDMIIQASFDCKDP